jgi:disulfide bond formation protein DsbB
VAQTKTQPNQIAQYAPYVAFTVALLAMAGSLYFSEVKDYLPCLLCWYQRICMYPLVAILAVGILRKDARMYQYVLPLVTVGFAIAVYHVFLYYGVFPESEETCRAGVSCTTKYIEYFGFVTIPLLSLTAFTIIGSAMLALRKYGTRS